MQSAPGMVEWATNMLYAGAKAFVNLLNDMLRMFLGK